MVPDPSFLTRAGQAQRMPNSRSVAVNHTWSPSVSRRMFDKIGMVVFFSTTPCVRPSSRTRSDLLTENSINDNRQLPYAPLLRFFFPSQVFLELRTKPY